LLISFSGKEYTMTNGNVMSRSVESAPWQDYRASNTGMVVFYASDPISELPIREVPEELPSEILPEPNYETGTYGFYGCAKSKIRTAFVKSKLRYLLFVTKYAGAKTEFRDKMVITGYYRIVKVADVKKMHIRYCSDYSCLDEDVCYALRAEDYRFVSIEDAYEVTDEILKSWGYNARITRQTRIILQEEPTLKIVEYLQSKNNITADYIKETKRLEPNVPEQEEEEEQDEGAGETSEGGAGISGDEESGDKAGSSGNEENLGEAGSPGDDENRGEAL